MLATTNVPPLTTKYVDKGVFRGTVNAASKSPSNIPTSTSPTTHFFIFSVFTPLKHLTTSAFFKNGVCGNFVLRKRAEWPEGAEINYLSSLSQYTGPISPSTEKLWALADGRPEASPVLSGKCCAAALHLPARLGRPTRRLIFKQEQVSAVRTTRVRRS